MLGERQIYRLELSIRMVYIMPNKYSSSRK